MTDGVIYDVVPRAGVIDLGKQVEGLVTRVVLPNIRRGAGTVQLVHQRSDDQEPYPVPITEDGDRVYWVVTRSDTAFPGRGQAELQWLGENGAVAKSVTYQTNTTRSMAEPGAVPDEPLRPYTQAVARDAQAAKDAAASATEAARTAEASAGQAGQAAQSAQEAALAAAQNAAAAETAKEAAKQAQTGAEEAKAAAEKAAQEAKTAQTGAMEAKTGAETARAKAEEAAQGIAADREQIAANKTDIESTREELTATKAALATTQKDLAKAQRAIKFQAELNQGQTWDFETDTQEAYQRQVPSGAKAGAVMAVGGKTVVWNQLMPKHNAVTGDKSLPFVAGTTFVNGHKYFLGYTSTYDTADVTTDVHIAGATTAGASFDVGAVSSASAGYHCGILTMTGTYTSNGEISGNGNIWIYVRNGNTVSGVTVINLTIMLGSGNEPTDTTDPRIAQIKAYAAAHPEYNAGELVSAQVDEVRVANSAGDSTDTYPIPFAVQALPGYGWSAGSVANTVERTENGWQYVQRVGSVGLGTLDWYDGGTATKARRMNSRTAPDNAKIPTISSDHPNVICKTYDRVSPDETWLCKKEGVTINTKNGIVIVYDSQYSTAESLAAFKQHVQGVILYYELATPITTDITALIGDALTPFAVEAGGSITLHHPKADEGFAIDVPANIQCITKLSEVTADG